MELPPGQRLRRSTPPPHGTADPDEDDRLSALPDDMLLQILARLGCARSAARADVLARRWRGLWIRLPDLAFRDVPAGEIQAALARVSLPDVSLLTVLLPRVHAEIWRGGGRRQGLPTASGGGVGASTRGGCSHRRQRPVLCSWRRGCLWRQGFWWRHGDGATCSWWQARASMEALRAPSRPRRAFPHGAVASWRGADG